MEQNQCRMNRTTYTTVLYNGIVVCGKSCSSQFHKLERSLTVQLSPILVKAKLRISFEQTTYNRIIDPSYGRTDRPTTQLTHLEPQYRRCRLQNVSTHLSSQYRLRLDWFCWPLLLLSVLMISKIILRRSNCLGPDWLLVQTTLVLTLFHFILQLSWEF